MNKEQHTLNKYPNIYNNNLLYNDDEYNDEEYVTNCYVESDTDNEQQIKNYSFLKTKEIIMSEKQLEYDGYSTE